MSEFIKRKHNDGRAVLCNKIFQVIVDKNNYDIEASLKEAEPFFEYLDEYIRNIYELIDHEMPLWALRDLLSHKEDHGEGNWGYTQEEYDSLVQDARNACELYYCMKPKK